MLNTKKLLFILSNVAYVAELLPGKKPNTFSVQKFKQINGEFLDDNEFISDNVVKLFSKLESEEYHLILPDFLFTNTIVTVEETGDAKVKKYLKEVLLPSLDLSIETHEVESFVLTELKGESKVQLSAIEKSLLAPLRVGATENKCKITAISPLSWAMKSVISLEPSISVVQLGDMVYAALQYIGIDQTNQAEVDDLEAISETIKTLKGSEPSIQTIYLLSNSVIEEQLKELLSGTIPVQQLNTLREDDGKMPSYIQDAIEISAKTLSIEDYPVPTFALQKATEEELKSLAVEVDEDKDMPEENKNEEISDLEVEEKMEPLPEPAKPEESKEDDVIETEEEKEEPAEEVKEINIEEKTADKPVEKAVDETKEEPTADTDEQDVDLSKFISHTTNDSEENNVSQEKTKNEPTVEVKEEVKEKVIIKNSSGVKPMLRMVFITLAVFAATVAIGIGVGLGLLRLNSSDTPDATPVVIAESPVPSPETSPSPSPLPEVERAELSILVVNATTQAGYAGDIGSLLEDAEYGTVDAGNAAGDYETGYFLLLDEENEALLEALSEDTGLDLEYDSTLDKETEDADGEYDAVVVLAETE